MLPYDLYYFQPTGELYSAEGIALAFGYDPTTTDIDVLNLRRVYPVNQTTPSFDPYLYTAQANYTISGNYADQSWTYTARPLAQAKQNATYEEKVAANADLNVLQCDCGFSLDLLTAVSSQDPLDRPSRYQAELDEMTAISDQLDSNLTAIDAATTIEEINNIVNKPSGLLFTGRGSGLGPEDLNVSYYSEFNSMTMLESDTELYVPGTGITIPYGSGGPNAFDSMGNAFNPGDYIMQIRQASTSMVIATIEVPLNPAGEDVVF